MTAQYYGINQGDNEYAAASGTSSTSKDVEVVIADITKVTSKEDLLLALEKLENFILRSNYWA
jgi:hypothetical protein